jgi:hypothetical protein
MRQVVDGVSSEPRVAVITDKLAVSPSAIRRVLPNTSIDDTGVCTTRRRIRTCRRVNGNRYFSASNQLSISNGVLGPFTAVSKPFPSSPPSLRCVRLQSGPHRMSHCLARYHSGRCCVRSGLQDQLWQQLSSACAGSVCRTRHRSPTGWLARSRSSRLRECCRLRPNRTGSARALGHLLRPRARSVECAKSTSA